MVVRSSGWTTRRALYQAVLLVAIIAPQMALNTWNGWSWIAPLGMSTLALAVNVLPRERNRRVMLRALGTGNFGPLDVPVRWWDLPLAFALGGVVVLVSVRMVP